MELCRDSRTDQRLKVTPKINIQQLLCSVWVSVLVDNFCNPVDEIKENSNAHFLILSFYFAKVWKSSAVNHILRDPNQQIGPRRMCYFLLQ